MTGDRPFLRFALRHRRLIRLLPDGLLVWLAWHIDIKRDPGMMAYLAQLARERREQR